jgi:hypothetical protein
MNETVASPLQASRPAREERRTRSLWWIAFQQRSVWARGAKLGLSVGVLQAIINQGDVWLAHEETLGTVLKTITSPLVTFSVALVSAAATYVEKLKLNS